MKDFFHSVPQFLSFKALEKTFKINLVKHGDKSSVNNLYKEITLLAESSDVITN